MFWSEFRRDNRISGADVTRVEALGDGGVARAADDSSAVGKHRDFHGCFRGGGVRGMDIQAEHKAIEADLSGFSESVSEFFEAEEE
jgi:hypothetical protein